MVENKRPLISARCSLFVIGLGHFYIGEYRRGGMFFLVALLSYVVLFDYVFVNMAVTALLSLFCALDAFYVTKHIMELRVDESRVVFIKPLN